MLSGILRTMFQIYGNSDGKSYILSRLFSLEVKSMVHYELMFFYMAGFKPKDMIKRYGYSRACAYRFYKIYRLARIKAKNIIEGTVSVSPEREKKLNSLD